MTLQPVNATFDSFCTADSDVIQTRFSVTTGSCGTGARLSPILLGLQVPPGTKEALAEITEVSICIN